jgi:hypothetical protein
MLGLVISGVIGRPGSRLPNAAVERWRPEGSGNERRRGGQTGEHAGDHPHTDDPLSAALSDILTGEALAGQSKARRSQSRASLAPDDRAGARNGLAAVGLRLPDAPAELAGSFCLS